MNHLSKILFLLLTCFALTANAKTPIIFWHSMAGDWGNVVKELTDEFNNSQQEFTVIPVYKGSYTESLTSTVAAFRAHKQPHIVQIYEVGTATMMYPQGVIVPLHQLLKETKVTLDENDFIPAILSYYSDKTGHLIALPFNSSTAVLYYNKDAFAKAKLDPNKPPATWPEVKEYSLALLKSGMTCGFTTTWPSWIQIENFSAWHNLPIATQKNGFEGFNAQFTIDNPTLLNHLSTLAQWQKQHIFQYGGRDDDAMSLFTSKQCAMVMESSGSLSSLKGSTPFSLGTAKLPYWPNVKGAPQNTLIGGAALWTLSGHNPHEYLGVAQFYKFLASPAIVAKWQAATGYLPITHAGFELAKKQGYYQKNPDALVAIEELNQHPPTDNSKGLRLGNYPQIRNVFDHELEAIWSGLKTPQQGLTDASQRGNELLKQFVVSQNYLPARAR